jgi:Flp pilus assembly secretin CpaC
VSPSRETGSIITKEEAIETTEGAKERLRTDAHIVDVAVTRPEVADALIAGDKELSLIAHSAGFGKVLVRLENGNTIAYKVRVYVADPEKRAAQLREKLGHIQGINIEVVKGKILIDGRVLHLKEMDAIERAVGDNPSVINLTSLSSRNARILAREIVRELRASGIYGADVEVRSNRVTLVGTLGSRLLVEKAETIASKYTPTFDSLLQVAPAQ